MLKYRVYDLDTGEVTFMYARSTRNLMRRLGRDTGRLRVDLVKNVGLSPESAMFHGGLGGKRGS